MVIRHRAHHAHATNVTGRYGVDFDRSQFCTPEKIDEAHASHFYATRGYTVIEEANDTRRYGLNPNNRSLIRHSINELVVAQVWV